MDQDEDFADLIKRQKKLDWNEIKPKLPSLTTEELVRLMVKLGLYVNQSLAQEIARRDDAIFYLRRLLQDGLHWWQEPEYGDGWSPAYALSILALTGREEALQLILDVLRYRGDELSDWLTEDAASILVAFGEKGVPKLKEFSEDETLEAFVRHVSTDALMVLAKKFPHLEPEIKEHFLKLLRTTKDPTFCYLVADNLACLRDPSVIPDIRRAYEAGRMECMPEDIEDMEKVAMGGYPELVAGDFERHGRSPLWQFSRENVEHMHRLHYSKAEERNRGGLKKKVGRNDPCPCGSGKKYKHCCWLKEIGVG